MAKGSSAGVTSGTASAEQLVTPGTTAAFVSEVVRRCPLHAVLESPGNRQSPEGDEKADGHAAHPNSPGRGRAWPGFSRLLCRSAGVTFQRFDQVLRPATGAVGSAGHVRQDNPPPRTPNVTSHLEQGWRTARRAKGLWLRAYARFASDLRRLPDGRMREAFDYVLDRQGLRPAPSDSATAS